MRPLIELAAYRLFSEGRRGALDPVDLTLARGDICLLDADAPEAARMLLRALATLVRPISGRFRFSGERLDFSDYRRLLPAKQRIGYVAPDAAMLSNRTLRQNLLTRRYYFENSLRIRLEPAAEALCSRLEIEKELDRLPAEVDPAALFRAIAVREASKSPELLLLNRPEEIMGKEGFRRFLQGVPPLLAEGCAWLCATQDPHFIGAFSSRRVQIRHGALTADAGRKTGAGR